MMSYYANDALEDERTIWRMRMIDYDYFMQPRIS